MLTLTRRLVQLHGGTLEARSDGDNRGSTFVVRLPVLPVPAAPSRVEPASRTEKLRIVAVDDNVDAADLMAALLEIAGHVVTVAHNGPDAIAVISERRPDVVLLDIALPGFDGYEVARRAC